MKIVTLKPEQFDKFASTHRYRNYFQTTAYGNTMTKFGYKVHYLGIVNDLNSLIGATMIMYKEVFMKNKIAYAPRGILFDYENTKAVKDLGTKLKNLLGKQGFMLLRMDPYIPISVRSNNGDILNINHQEDMIINNLKQAGFDYKGKNLYFENEHSRWEALVLLNKSENELFDSFDKRTRNKIRKAINAGIIVEQDGKKNIKPLYELIKNGERKSIKFYEELKNSFEDNLEIYYAKIDTEAFVVNSRRIYEQELQNNEQLAEQVQNFNLNPKDRTNYLNKKMESDKLISAYKNNLLLSTRLLKEYPEGITIGGCITIIYDHAAYIYTEGFNQKYAHLNPNYLIKWELIKEYTTRGYKYLNLNAIVGEFEKENKYRGLNEMKLGYHTIITEYVGEFDIILNNFTYSLYKNFNK